MSQKFSKTKKFQKSQKSINFRTFFNVNQLNMWKTCFLPNFNPFGPWILKKVYLMFIHIMTPYGHLRGYQKVPQLYHLWGSWPQITFVAFSSLLATTYYLFYVSRFYHSGFMAKNFFTFPISWKFQSQNWWNSNFYQITKSASIFIKSLLTSTLLIILHVYTVFIIFNPTFYFLA